MIVRLLIALLLGLLSYFLARLVFNEVISVLIGAVVALAFYFGLN